MENNFIKIQMKMYNRKDSRVNVLIFSYIEIHLKKRRGRKPGQKKTYEYKNVSNINLRFSTRKKTRTC